MQNVNDLGIHSRNTLNILHLLSESWFQPHQGDQGVEEEKKEQRRRFRDDYRHLVVYGFRWFVRENGGGGWGRKH